MAKGFAINGNLQIKGPPNLNAVANKIRTALSNIPATVNLKINSATINNANTLNKSLVSINNNFKRINTSGTQLQHTLAQVASGFRKVNTAINTASIQKTSQGINQIGNSTKNASRNISTFGEMIGMTTKRFSAFVTASAAVISLTGAMTEGFRKAFEFQQELVKLKQVGGDSASAIRGIATQVDQLSTKLGVSSESLVKVAGTLRQAGLNAGETKSILSSLAKTELAPTFENIEKTTEGVISIMNQFKISARDMEGVLGSVNKVSAEYAVESGDIIEAVRRAGSTFKAAGGDINEFMGAFTSIRATTRLSASTIAAAMNTIFSRFQQGKAIENLDKLGVKLRDTSGQFVGPIEAVKRLNEALANIDSRDARFSKIATEFGGVTRLKELIPLLKEVAVSEQAVSVARQGSTSLDREEAIAQESLINKVSKLKEEFLSLFRAIAGDTSFQVLARTTLDFAIAATQLTKAITPLIPLLGAIGAVKAFSGAGGFAKNIFSGFTKRAGGGVIPGSGLGDSVPAMLTPGEFVINKHSAQSIGYAKLASMNRYANGGTVQVPDAIRNLFQSLGLGDLSRSGSITSGINFLPDVKHKGISVGGLFGRDKSIKINTQADEHSQSQILFHELIHALDRNAGGGGYSSHSPGSRYFNLAQQAKSVIPLPGGPLYKGGNQNDEHLAYGGSWFFEYKAKLAQGEKVKLKKGIQEFFDEFEKVIVNDFLQHTSSQKSSVKTKIQTATGGNGSIIPPGTALALANQPSPQQPGRGFNIVPPTYLPRLKYTPPTFMGNLKGAIGRFSPYLIAASLAAPYVSDQLLGNAQKPGRFGRRGAGAGSVLSGALAGAGAGMLTGNPYVALAGAAFGAVSSLYNFKKEIDDIDLNKMTEKFSSALSGFNATTGKFNTSAASSEFTSSVSGLRNQIRLNRAYSKGYQQQFQEETIKPLVNEILGKFREAAAANPGKDLEQIKAMFPPEFTKFVQDFGGVSKTAVEETKNYVKRLAEAAKTQKDLDLSFAHLMTSSEQLSRNINHTADQVERNFTRNAIGRGGNISGGSDFLNINSLGGIGSQLHSYTKFGGGLDQVRSILKDALFSSVKNGLLEQESVQSKVGNVLDNSDVFKGPVGNFIKTSIMSKMNGEAGQKFLANAHNDPEAALKGFMEDIDNIRPIAERASQDMARAMQAFAQDAVSLEELVNKYLEEETQFAQLQIRTNHERGVALMANNTQHFFDRRGNVISPADQLAELNRRSSVESFRASQQRYGIYGNPFDSNLITGKLRQEMDNLNNLKNSANQARLNGGNKDFSQEIAKSTATIANLQEALKNLAGSTTVLEAAQNKLNLEIEKETADREGRKSTAETLAFGSRSDIARMMRSEQLIGVAAQQGHLNNFTDEQRQAVFERLQQTSGVVRQFGRQKVTSQNLIDMISEQFMPNTMMQQKMVNTPNGPRQVSQGVAESLAVVKSIQDNMQKAADAFHEFNQENIAKQFSEHSKAFIDALDSMRDKILKEMIPAKGHASGGYIFSPQGTDTVPAMLTPGEMVMSKNAVSKNKSVLSSMNQGAVYRAGGGAVSPAEYIRQAAIRREQETKAAWERVDQARSNQRTREMLFNATSTRKPLADPDAEAQASFLESQRRLANSQGKTVASHAYQQSLLNTISNSSGTNPIVNPPARRMQQNFTGVLPANYVPRTRRGSLQMNAPRNFGDFARRPSNNSSQINNNLDSSAKAVSPENFKPLIEALNNFPRELTIKRDGKIEVIINGMEAMAKIKGDLEKEVWDKIIATIKTEAVKAVKNMPGG